MAMPEHMHPDDYSGSLWVEYKIKEFVIVIDAELPPMDGRGEGHGCVLSHHGNTIHCSGGPSFHHLLSHHEDVLTDVPQQRRLISGLLRNEQDRHGTLFGFGHVEGNCAANTHSYEAPSATVPHVYARNLQGTTICSISTHLISSYHY